MNTITQITFNTKCAKDAFYLGALVIGTCDKHNLDCDFEFPADFEGVVKVSLSGAGSKKLKQLTNTITAQWEAYGVEETSN